MGDLIEELTEYGRHLQREDDEAQINDAWSKAEEEKARAEEEKARRMDYESKILLLEKKNAELKAKLAAKDRNNGDRCKWETL